MFECVVKVRLSCILFERHWVAYWKTHATVWIIVNILYHALVLNSTRLFYMFCHPQKTVVALNRGIDGYSWQTRLYEFNFILYGMNHKFLFNPVDQISDGYRDTYVCIYLAFLVSSPSTRKPYLTVKDEPV